MQERREKFEHGPLLFHRDTNGRERNLGLSELLCIVNSRNWRRLGTALAEVLKLRNVSVEAQVLALFERRAGTELVEDVIVALGEWLEDDT